MLAADFAPLGVKNEDIARRLALKTLQDFAVAHRHAQVTGGTLGFWVKEGSKGSSDDKESRYHVFR
jgi:hypothetical protein